MDGFWTLLLLSTVMGGASFLAGLLPLSFSLSPRNLRLITALGTGVLVGTSLIVIIPEGVDTLYKASTSSHGHGHDERSLPVSRRSLVPWNTSPEAQHHDHWKRFATSEDPSDLSAGLQSGPDDGFNPLHSNPALTTTPAENESGAGSRTAAEREPHAWIGVSLGFGFLLMFLIDKVPRHASKHSQPQSFPISLNQFSINNSRSTPTEETTTPRDDVVSTTPYRLNPGPSSTTMGLVIHATADGIALGASSTTSSDLSFVIFIALLIHKAPAAFGLTSVLLKQGLSTREARTHLVIFSLAAPIGALLAWSAIKLGLFSMVSPGGSASAEFAVGCVLLFSGGTFLYVAMHAVQEGGLHDQTHDMEYAGSPRDDAYTPHMPNPSQSHIPAIVDTLVTAGGMLLPLLTQFGHSH
ncbi:related to ATX2-Putative Golgi transporter involved in homeostasis of manganese ions [Ramularia collo-cygni]|uniref:Related to ATX2-Putative Golgi transporter involved in homeostasis of manganese ions n=1 Tax=Ramularia collo-cygni TaxID=112498 RepID=A0A2D3VM52_9PEZI|nr:related to ATX2-Putative Golgi transporter involved in homeostasis of manganese ions [Ramularia collo-cygni]CZT24859.1 related to ATX2-Putative Golgi transporter involved in homeostasis of manganese ions [Ramularia collo-cygni]